MRSDTDDLFLPTRDGLVQPGCPVAWGSPPGSEGRRGICTFVAGVFPHPNGTFYDLVAPYQQRGEAVALARSDLFLDLEERPGRNRAAEWLAKRLDMAVGCTAPVWKRGEDAYSLTTGAVPEAASRCLFIGEVPARHVETLRWLGVRFVVVPELGPLLPEEGPGPGSLLADNSRHVDALALKLACLGVALT